MRLNLTPWFRDALTAAERRSLAQRGPSEFVFQGSAHSARGPFRATIFLPGHPAAEPSGRLVEVNRNSIRAAIEIALTEGTRLIEDKAP